MEPMFRDYNFLKLIKQKGAVMDVSGKYFVQPIVTSPGVGVSSTFTSAQSYEGDAGSSAKAFLVKPAHDYSIATVGADVILATQDNEGAYVDAIKFEVDARIQQLTFAASQALFGNGDAVLGQISTYGTVGTGVVQLVNVGDIVNFEVGMAIQVFDARTSTAVTSSSVTGYVVSVNRSDGQFTVAATKGGAASSGLTSWTTSLYIRAHGNIPTAATTAGWLKPCGVFGWVPSTAPSASESFWGVDRSVDSSRLAGSRYTATSGQTPLAAIKSAATLLRRAGTGKPDVCVVSPSTLESIETELFGKFVHNTVDSRQFDVGVKGIVIHTAAGDLTLIDDISCPDSVALITQLDSWSILALGGQFCRPFDSKNAPMLSHSSSSLSLECRLASIYNFACSNPGASCCVTLA